MFWNRHHEFKGIILNFFSYVKKFIIDCYW